MPKNFVNNLARGTERHGGIKCLYTNADSVLNKLTELEAYIEKESIDIVAITETLCKNPQDDYNPVFIIQGFDCILNNEGRGTLLFIRNNLEYVNLSHCEDIFSPCTVCKINIDKDNEFIFGVIYRSPSCTEEESLNVNKLICYISEKYIRSNVILVGDFNYRDIDWKKDLSGTGDKQLASKFLKCIHSNYLVQLVDEPTHHRGTQTPTLIDLILTNHNDVVHDIEYHPPLGKSHHSVLCFNLSICANSNVKENVEKYRLDKGDFGGMRDYVSKIDWKLKLKDGDSLNDWSGEFLKCMEEAKSIFVPKKRFSPHKPKRKFAAPVTLLETIQLKRKAFKRKKTIWHSFKYQGIYLL